MPAAAYQDDVPLRFSAPDALFDGRGGVRGLVGATATLDLSRYILGGDYHVWHGRAAGDIALMGFGPDVHWRMGLSVQTVADHRNSIDFRLVRLYYEAPLAVDWRVGPGVATLMFRHRCGHGADSAVQDRILIRTNLELGYRAAWTLGGVDVQAESTFGVTVIGQNTDRAFQPRLLGTLTAGLVWRVGSRLSLTAGAGLGLAAHSAGNSPPPPNDEGVYSLSDPWGDLAVVWLPVAAAGMAYRGEAATLRFQLHFQRLNDTGLGTTRNDAWLLAPRLSFEL